MYHNNKQGNMIVLKRKDFSFKKSYFTIEMSKMNEIN